MHCRPTSVRVEIRNVTDISGMWYRGPNGLSEMMMRCRSNYRKAINPRDIESVLVRRSIDEWLYYQKF